MKPLSLRSVLLPLSLLTLGVPALVATAQSSSEDGPPKVLVIQREFTKPGRGGAMHEKTEGAFIHAMEGVKADPHYVAMTSITGPARALFLSGYPSFAAWEEENKRVYGDPVHSAALDHANVVDGDLLASTDASAWVRRDDLSMNPGGLNGIHYFIIRQFMVRPGHTHDWENLVKLVMEGYKKGVPEASWDVFQQQFGTDDAAYLVIIRLKAGSEIDAMNADDDKFAEALGGDGMKKMAELEASSVEHSQSNLFMIDPKMSRPLKSWVDADPDFWKTKSEAPQHKTASHKPAE